MEREKIIQYLFENQDSKYRDFHSRLIPGTEDIIGVRVPILQKLAKQIAKSDYSSYLKQVDFQYYEERMVYGLVLGSIRKDFETVMYYLKGFIPVIDNWAVCDSLCSSLKEVKKHRESVLPYLLECCDSSEEYIIRFAVVMLMNYYCDQEHIEILLSEFNKISNEAYYVRMGVAWAVSLCFVKCRERTIEHLLDNKMDDWTHNKSIQKIVESFRVSAEDKEMVKTLKRVKL